MIDWTQAILWYGTFVVSATVHEAAHALFAKLGGDLTAYRGGQVSLNPIPHMQREPFGMIALPLLSLYLNGGSWCFGYATTPIDPNWAWHHPRRAALMSAAGPLANVLLAAIAFAVLWVVGVPASSTTEAIRRIASTFLFLNLLLAVFNVIPLPPLDGAGIVEGINRQTQRLYDMLRRLPYIVIVTFVVANQLVPYVFVPLYRAVIGWLPR
ncbi:MAG: site-2 protease family protein [Planctomycetota bacterium]